jgi:uncharacterized membrane protein YphA (DoxX/SURF4 family)
VKEWWGLLARLVTGGVWIVAGAVKLPDPAQSVAAVRAYQLLPSSIVPTVGQLLPVIEIVVGVCLVLGILTRGAAVVSALLFVAFIVGISSVWARGINIDCGCFGGGGATNGVDAAKYAQEMVRDLALLGLALFVALGPSSAMSVDRRMAT